MSALKSKLIGGWSLIEWSTIVNGSDKIYPMGKNVNGMIIYTSEGFMSANILSMERLDSIPQGVTLASMFEGNGAYLSYAGKYSVNDEESYAVHYVKISSCPEWLNTEQKRNFKVAGNELIINSNTESGSMQFSHTLIWKRMI